MATIADEFIVRLGLDPTSFRAGAEEVERSFTKTKDVASKTGKQMEESNKLLSASFGKVRNELLAFYAALLGGRAMKEFIGDTIEGAAAVGRFAQNIGSTPAQVVGWEQAVERMGGTAQDADKSLDALSKALFQVHNMGNALPPELYRLQAGFGKIAATKFDQQHGVVPFMNDIAAQAKKLADVDPQGAFRLLQGAGISDSVANTMIKYGSGMSAFVDSIGGANAPTQAAIKAAQDLQDKWAQVRQTVDSIGNRSLPDLDAAIKPFLDDVLAVLNYFKEGDKILAPLRGLRETEKLPQNVHGHADWGAYWEHIKGAAGSAEGAIGRYFGGRERNEATPIPWGDWLRKLGESIIPSAQGAELPQGRASTGLSGEHSLRVHGQELSSSNPLPVDVVRNSIITPGGQGNGNYGNSTSLLGGPIGSGGLHLRNTTGEGARDASTLRDRAAGGELVVAGQDHNSLVEANCSKSAGLSEARRAGVVAHRWSWDQSGRRASRIAQRCWRGAFRDRANGRIARGGAAMRGADFDTQIGHAIDELKTTEARAAAVLRNAKTPEEGARGASMFERAEHYNPSTGIDDWTARTPVGKVIDVLRRGEGRNLSTSPLPERRLLDLLTNSTKASVRATGPFRRLLPTIKFLPRHSRAVSYRPRDPAF